MDPVVVVGAGLSGVAAARVLVEHGLPVRLLDRGRRAGGRMAVRTVEDRPVDIGASYLTVSDPAFEAVVEDWRQRGLARPWTDTLFSTDRPGVFEPHQGAVRWAAPLGLRRLVEDLVEGLPLERATVERVDAAGGLRVDGQPAAAVLLAMPDPQARRLLGPGLELERAVLDDPFEPVLALTARWSERCWPDFDGLFVNGDAVLSWVADDGRRRGDDAPVLVAHSTPELAAAHLDAPQEAAAAMTTVLRTVLDIAPEPLDAHVHRWSFARPVKGHDEPFHLGTSLVGICGDAWAERARVEAAWLSGTAVAEEVVRRLG